MKNLNTQWKYLIVILMLSLIASVVWEIYSINTDTRSEFRPVEKPLINSDLLSEPVLDHLRN